MNKLVKVFSFVCFLPIATLALAYLIVSQYDGWGEFGNTVLFYFPLFLSVAFTLFGTMLLVFKKHEKKVIKTLATTTVISATPLLKFLPFLY